MAVKAQTPKQTNWWVWGGVAVLAIVLITLLGFGLDSSGTEAVDTAAPATEEAAPATN